MTGSAIQFSNSQRSAGYDVCGDRSATWRFVVEHALRRERPLEKDASPRGAPVRRFFSTPGRASQGPPTGAVLREPAPGSGSVVPAGGAPAPLGDSGGAFLPSA